jgi:hypothetical protein
VIVDNSFAYKTSRATISKRIKSDFSILEKAVEKMQECKVINDFNETFNFADFKAEHSDLDSIKSWLEKCAKWEGKISLNIKAQE